ncbi:hypothetical protein TKK_0016704 [Trichogramma kaykai]
MAEHNVRTTPLMALTPIMNKKTTAILVNIGYKSNKIIFGSNKEMFFFNVADESGIIKCSAYCRNYTTAIVKNIQPLVNIHSTRTKKNYIKQEIELINDTNFKIILTLWSQPKNLNLEIFKIYSFTNLRITQGNYSKGLNTIVESTAIEDTESPIAIKLLPTLQNMIKNNNQTNTFQNTNDFEIIDDDLLCAAMEEFEKTSPTTLNTTINKKETTTNTMMDEIFHNVFTTSNKEDFLLMHMLTNIISPKRPGKRKRNSNPNESVRRLSIPERRETFILQVETVDDIEEKTKRSTTAKQ